MVEIKTGYLRYEAMSLENEMLIEFILKTGLQQIEVDVGDFELSYPIRCCNSDRDVPTVCEYPSNVVQVKSAHDEKGDSLDVEEDSDEELDDEDVGKWYAVVCSTEEEREMLNLWYNWPNASRMRERMDEISRSTIHVRKPILNKQWSAFVHSYLNRRPVDGTSVVIVESVESADILGLEVLLNCNWLKLPKVIDENQDAKEGDVSDPRNHGYCSIIEWLHVVGEATGLSSAGMIGEELFDHELHDRDERLVAQQLIEYMVHTRIAKIRRFDIPDMVPIQALNINSRMKCALMVEAKRAWDRAKTGACCSILHWLNVYDDGLDMLLGRVSTCCRKMTTLKVMASVELCNMEGETCDTCDNILGNITNMEWSEDLAMSSSIFREQDSCIHGIWETIIREQKTNFNNDSRRGFHWQGIASDASTCSSCMAVAEEARHALNMWMVNQNCCHIYSWIVLNSSSDDAFIVAVEVDESEDAAEKIEANISTARYFVRTCFGCNEKIRLFKRLTAAELAEMAERRVRNR